MRVFYHFWMEPKKNVPIKWAEPELRMKPGDTNIQSRHFSVFHPDLDLCYVYDFSTTDPRESVSLTQHFARNHKSVLEEKDQEIAGMYVLRDINTIENLIDFSYAPHCWHNVNYDSMWDPKVYRMVNTDMNKRRAEQATNEEYEDDDIEAYTSDGQIGSTTTSENK